MTLVLDARPIDAVGRVLVPVAGHRCGSCGAWAPDVDTVTSTHHHRAWDSGPCPSCYDTPTDRVPQIGWVPE